MSKQGIYTKNFIICFISTFIFSFSFYYLIPVMPVYFEGIGKSKAEIGIIIGAFFAASIILRPVVGVMLKTYSGKSLMILGSVIFAIAPALYLTTTSTVLLTAIRIFHGMGVATFMTSAVIMVADTVPRERLAHATGVYFTSANAALGIAPLVGTTAGRYFSFSAQMIFLAASALAVIILLINIDGQSREKVLLQPKPFLGVLKERNVLVPTVVFASCTFVSGTINAFLPLQTLTWGYHNSGLYFFVSASTVVAVRFVGGGLSDSFGRKSVILPCLVITSLGTMFLPLVHTPLGLALCAFFYGAGFGLLYPTLNATVVERVLPENRSTALGIFSTSVDGGQFLGPAVMGYVGQYFGFGPLFVTASLAPLGGLLVYLLGLPSSKKSPALTARRRN
ncbi:MFS transporter [Pelotomaculum propionicicum]|uniref:MFS transporter n=1 Tax=Pelotomaculum propionicicum TaxID=258475 RepID=UPI003B81E6D0